MNTFLEFPTEFWLVRDERIEQLFFERFRFPRVLSTVDRGPKTLEEASAIYSTLAL